MVLRQSKSLLLGFATFVLAAVSLLILWTVWSLSYPQQVLTATPDSWTVQNPGKRVARGEPLFVYVDYCLSIEQAPRLDMLFEQDSQFIPLDALFPPATVGCHKVTSPIITIPKSLPDESTTARGDGKNEAQRHAPLSGQPAP